MANLLLILQIIIGICFTGILLSLFKEGMDYLTYVLLFVFIIGISTFLLIDVSEEQTRGIILAVDWEVVVFLFCLFCIVEILNENRIFQVIAIKIVNKFHDKPRLMFWVICISSTLIATIIEDLSVAMIFVPIMIQTCRKMEIDASPYLFGITICINLASTLTPFGSAENVIIANYFKLSLHWHLVNLGVYFIFTTLITLFLLDKFILRKAIRNYYVYKIYSRKSRYFSSHPTETTEETIERVQMLEKLPLQDLENYHKMVEKEIVADPPEGISMEEYQQILSDNLFDIKINKKDYKKNIIGLILFTFVLVLITQIVISGIIGLLLFIFLNPQVNEEGEKKYSLTFYLNKINPKLIYFFIMLFITVYFMELAGLTGLIENLVERWANHNPFLIAIELIWITSLLSGFLDDAPITILFLPIIMDTTIMHPNSSNLFFIAFTLGINLGGNFLPQGAACDMMTLELAKFHKVKDFTYKRLTLVGGAFALLHIVLGIFYLWIFNLF